MVCTKIPEDDELVNTELRTLNYEHIFEYPFKEEMDSTLMIFNGLQELALPYKKRCRIKEKTLSD
jgi:5-methylthioribose kinase